MNIDDYPETTDSPPVTSSREKIKLLKYRVPPWSKPWRLTEWSFVNARIKFMFKQKQIEYQIALFLYFRHDCVWISGLFLGKSVWLAVAISKGVAHTVRPSE